MRERGIWDESWNVWDVEKIYQSLRRNEKEGGVAHEYRSIGVASRSWVCAPPDEENRNGDGLTLG